MLTDAQMVYLRQEAGRLGISMAEVLRRILDEHRERRPAPAELADPEREVA
jgi:hypothetical protein